MIRLKKQAVLLLTVMFLAHCASVKKAGTPSGTSSAPESSSVATEGVLSEGELPPSGAQIFGPAPPGGYPVVVVLGPGMARALASAGVLRAIRDAKIPIGAIVGVEMGALVGAIYAVSKTLNEFEWEMQRIKEDLFSKEEQGVSAWLSRGNTEKKFNEMLNRIFGNQLLSSTRVPLKIVVWSGSEQRAQVIAEGKITDALRAAFETKKNRFESAALYRPFPVEVAKNLSLGPTILVDVLEGAPLPNPTSGAGYFEQMLQARKNGEIEAAGADVVLRPEMKEITYFDFKKKPAAIFFGKKETVGLISKIQSLREGVTP